MATELLGEAIEEHFKPYALRHSLIPDDLLVEYALELMNSSATSKWFSNWCKMSSSDYRYDNFCINELGTSSFGCS